MPEIGQTISHYTIIEKLGAGGMGEVYKARDTRLDRPVALKVLKPAAVPSADLRLRFEREARAIARLNHPHICALFDIGRDGDTHFFVMEYCEGETLAQRLMKGPLQLDQVLRYGTEVANALDKAHLAGIVHRDLKPGNVMITRSGVKLLDFGLAKLRQTNTPTGELLTQATATEPLTAAGTILGTLHYMAPEQLEGKEADVRADIFALGAVLYEMVTGRKAFGGSNAASVISAVMGATPKAIATLQPLTPPALEQVVATCLAKDPEERWQSAADVARQLRWISEQPAESVRSPIATKPRGTTGTIIWASALLVLGILTGGALGYLFLRSAPSPKEPEKFILPLPADAPLAQPKDLPLGGDWPALAISPDGRRFAYVAVHNGARLLYVRQIDEFDFRPLKGTEGASNPIFRPDGEWLGFWSEGRLKRVAFNGGAASDVCTQEYPIGATWAHDGSMIFGDTKGCLWSVPQEGGKPVLRFDPQTSITDFTLPRLLSDGNTVLGTGWGDSKLLSLSSGTLQIIFSMGGNPYLTSTGHLVAGGTGTLLAAPFDEKTKKTGDYRTVLEDLRTTCAFGVQYALSDTGSLIYASGGATDEGRLVKVDKGGYAQDLGAKPGIFQHVAAAPKNDLIAVLLQTGDKMALSVVDLRRPQMLKLISPEGTVNMSPVWSPQGDKIAFSSDLGGRQKMWVQAAEGGAEATLVCDASDIPSDWSGDGRLISTYATGSKSNRVLRMLRMGAETQPAVLLDLGSDTSGGKLSSDQRWLLYASNKSGNEQIYMRPWPITSSGEIQISTQGGSDALWSKDGKEVFYRNGSQFMKVAVPDSTPPWIPKPELMFTGNYLNASFRPWDVMPDGQHFVMIQPTHPDPPKTELYLIQNWFEELKRLVPTGRR